MKHTNIVGQILLESPMFYRRYYKKTFWSLFLDTLWLGFMNSSVGSRKQSVYGSGVQVLIVELCFSFFAQTRLSYFAISVSVYFYS